MTLLFPHAGHINRPSSLPSGKFGPRVQTSVSSSSCLRWTHLRMERVSCRQPLAQRICTFQPRLLATPSVSTSDRASPSFLGQPPCTSLQARRSFGQAFKALNRTVEFDRYWPDYGKVWDKNHLTILIQRDWLHLAGAAGATLVRKFIRNIPRRHERWRSCPLDKDAVPET